VSAADLVDEFAFPPGPDERWIPVDGRGRAGDEPPV